MKQRIFLIFGSICLIATSLLGCRNNITEGHYEGEYFLATSEDSKIEPVQIDVHQPYRKRVLAQIYDIENKAITFVEVFDWTKKVMKIHIPKVRLEPFVLDRKGSCYESVQAENKTNRPMVVSFCVGLSRVKVEVFYFKEASSNFQEQTRASGLGRVFGAPREVFVSQVVSDRHIAAPTDDTPPNIPPIQPWSPFQDDREMIFYLSGNQFTKTSIVENLEEPVELTADQAIERMLDENYDVRGSYHRVIEARKLAQAAAWNLLPRIRFSAFVPVGSLNLTGVLVGTSIPDWTPFLIPSRWMGAKREKIQSRLEEDAFDILRANLISETEQMMVSYLRDDHIQVLYADFLERMQETANLYNQGIALPLDDEKSLSIRKRFEFLIRLLDQRWILAKNAFRYSQYALSFTLGFRNPVAVKGLDWSRERIPIESATAHNPQVLANQSVKRSFEVRQLERSIEVASLDKKMINFLWIDPVSHTQYGLGPAMIPQHKAKSEQIAYLNVEMEKIRSLVIQKAFVAQTLNTGMLDAYDKVHTLVKTSKEELLRFPSRVEDLSIDVAVLVETLNLHFGNLILGETILAEYRKSRANIDRLLLTGYHQQAMERLFSPADPSLSDE